MSSAPKFLNAPEGLHTQQTPHGLQPQPQAAAILRQPAQLPLNTDRWYYRVFQSAPDLIRALLPGSAAATNDLGLNPAAQGDRLYRFESLEIKELSHRLDGVLWPREGTGCGETGSPEFPVVLLEVQMHPDPGFRHRLAAQTCRFLQKQTQVEHLPAAESRPPAQPAHPAGAPRERAAGLHAADPRQPPDLDTSKSW